MRLPALLNKGNREAMLSLHMALATLTYSSGVGVVKKLLNPGEGAHGDITNRSEA